MIKQVLGTMGTRVIATLVTFLIVVLNTRTLGLEGQGNIALINITIAVILALNNFIGGGAVIYLIPRKPLPSLMKASYFWAMLVAILASIILRFWKVFPDYYEWHIAAIALLHSWFLFNSEVLLGKMRVKEYNLLMILQVGIILLSLSWLFLILDMNSLFSYILALYLSFGISFLVSLWMIKSEFHQVRDSLKLKDGLSSLWNYGKFNQTAYLNHLLNKRLSFVILDSFKWIGRSGVGLFSIGTQFSEAISIASGSLATVQYSKISNSSDQAFNLRLTVVFTKVSFFISVFGIITLLAVPESIYQWIFDQDVKGLKYIILFMSPGIIALSCNAILTHHFSGIGRHKVGMKASFVALGVMLSMNFLLIPLMGMNGAALAVSLAFFSQALYHAIILRRDEGVLFRNYIPKMEDFRMLRNTIVKFKP